ncbi:saccharopine dehydrogenase [Gordonia sp. TBRC 11910]|uniref:Saccharopine dehydrogenase n=1 Tax=Gordonia asplenii TaxID=2725283 RepID=A0A848KUM2_9ACTN|nr:saccharopine dehydrogenase NADP-binding domain-containing protein [Gordonia asplenii]NMO02230.1 saccharopine dehydrogenase [Gordonia asplenii]
MASTDITIAVVGAGEMGRSALAHLARRLPDARFRVIDLNANNLAKAVALDPRRITAEQINYRETTPDLRGVALVANFAGPFYLGSNALARIAIAAGCDYFDICDDTEGIHPILDLDLDAKAADVTLVTGGGNSPGTSNLMAKRLLELNPDADGIRIVWVADDVDPGGLAPLRHMLHMTVASCPIWQDGRFVDAPGFVPCTARTHRLPVLGDVEAYNTAHSETITLARAFPHLRHISVQGALHPAWASEAFSTLGRIGFGFSDLSVQVGEHTVDPVEVLWKVLWARHDIRPNVRSGLSLQQVQALAGDDIVATMTYWDRANMARTTGLSAASQIIAMLDGNPPSGAWGTEVLPAQPTLALFEEISAEIGAVPDGILLDTPVAA